jgi:hypothetical protein
VHLNAELPKMARATDKVVEKSLENAAVSAFRRCLASELSHLVRLSYAESWSGSISERHQDLKLVE